MFDYLFELIRTGWHQLFDKKLKSGSSFSLKSAHHCAIKYETIASNRGLITRYADCRIKLLFIKFDYLFQLIRTGRHQLFDKKLKSGLSFSLKSAHHCAIKNETIASNRGLITRYADCRIKLLLIMFDYVFELIKTKMLLNCFILLNL